MALDKNLSLKDSLTFDFIPDFVKEGQPCDFISPEKALEVAKANFKEKGFEIYGPELKNDEKQKQYIYTINNKLTQSPRFGKLECMEINALTAEIKTYEGAFCTMAP